MSPQAPAFIGFRELARHLVSNTGLTRVVGASGSAPALLIRELLSAGDARQVLYVTPNARVFEAALDDLEAWRQGLPIEGYRHPLEGVSILPFPVPETSPYSETYLDRTSALERASALHSFVNRRPSVLVTTANALVRRVPPPTVMKTAGFALEKGSVVDIEGLSRQLIGLGYLRTPLVEDPGTFAVRGGIVDVWPGLAPLPCRAEMDGEVLSDLKHFSPEDQRTASSIACLQAGPVSLIPPKAKDAERVQRVLQALCDQANLPTARTKELINDLLLDKNRPGFEGFLPAFFELESLCDYLGPDGVVVMEDPPACVKQMREELSRAEEQSQRSSLPTFPRGLLYLDETGLMQSLRRRSSLLCFGTGIFGQPEQDDLDALEAIEEGTLSLQTESASKPPSSSLSAKQQLEEGLGPWAKALSNWQSEGRTVVISARTEHQRDRMTALFSHRHLELREASLEPPSQGPNSAFSVVSPLSRGLLAPFLGLSLLTEEEIFGTRAHRKAPSKKRLSDALEDLRTLTPGDYVVHTEHGVGRYLGLVHQLAGGINVDLLAIEYQGNDKLYVPVYRLNLVQKYGSKDQGAPKLDRLGGATFAKTKATAKKRARDLADQLLRLYAERAQVKKAPLPLPGDEYQAFEAAFPFDETPDQEAAISEVISDLTNTRVMDRLVCGDVGFGKTEVALRAAFLHTMAGRQVALLCPTTVLAQQHFQTFSARFADLPLVVKPLSRFQSKKEQLATLTGLKQGSVDLVVGTHRLLSRDVHFKNLGLLIVDEEQRFGVSHKERIKALRHEIDVLTLSATPIPRTLQMALGGLRDLSIITTPPVDRRSVRTLIAQFTDELVGEAINRELDRGGQVFFVYNRIEGLYERAERLRALVPRAKIAVAHGQMSETALEKTMLGFVRGDFDILVSTAIVESGLDIPRANTLIIDRADLFGLGQLHQLRGRVGRSNQRAYCYLLVPKPSALTDEAKARVEALERYAELGSGLLLARLDMEQRGTGELLGSDQSGFIEGVGFDLFCEMLEEATRELRGEEVAKVIDPELSFDVEALLPEDYVSDVGLRLSLYKRLSSAEDAEKVSDLAQEIEERFGRPPPETRRLFEVMRFKTELRALRVLSSEATKNGVTLHFSPDTPLDASCLMERVARKNSGYRLTPEGRLSRRPLPHESPKNGLSLLAQVLNDLAPCRKL